MLALESLLRGGDGDGGGVLVVHGEGGVGKTALLEYAIEGAAGFLTIRAAGVEAEIDSPSQPSSCSARRFSTAWPASPGLRRRRSESPSGSGRARHPILS